LQTDDLLFSYNIQFMYEYYAIEKQDILYACNAATSSCRRASFLQLFRKFVQSPLSPK